MRMRSTLLLSAALAAAALSALPARAEEPEKVDLKLSVRAGEKYYFRQTQKMEQAMKVGEMDMTTTMNMVQTTTYVVSAVRENGETDLTVTIGAIKGTFENAMLGTVEFDSESDEDLAASNPMLGPMLKGLTTMAHKEIKTTLDARGRVVNVSGMKEILEEAFKDNPAMKGLAGKGGLGGMLDDEGMKQQMQGTLARFPEAAVAVGSKWNVDSEVKSPVVMKVASEYTLKSADAAEAVIGTSVSMAVGRPEGAQGPEVPPIKTEGSVRVSRKDGLPIRAEQVMKMSMDMPMRGQGAEAGQSMHMDQTMTTTFERITEAEAAPAKKEAKPAEAPAGGQAK